MQLRKMQSIKKEQASLDAGSSVDKMMVLNSALTEVSEDLTTGEELLLNEGSVGKNRNGLCQSTKKEGNLVSAENGSSLSTQRGQSQPEGHTNSVT